jgi:hypothetical protein
MIFHKQRREERTSVAVDARILVGEYDCQARLLNASAHGVLAALPQPPAPGTRVRLIVGEMVLAGQVRWRGVDCCGIALRDPISVADLIDGRLITAFPSAGASARRSIGCMLRSLANERASGLRRLA